MEIQANTSNHVINKITKKKLKKVKSPDLTKMFRIDCKLQGNPKSSYFFHTEKKRDRFINKHEFEYLKIY